MHGRPRLTCYGEIPSGRKVTCTIVRKRPWEAGMRCPRVHWLKDIDEAWMPRNGLGWRRSRKVTKSTGRDNR